MFVNYQLFICNASNPFAVFVRCKCISPNPFSDSMRCKCISPNPFSDFVRCKWLVPSTHAVSVLCMRIACDVRRSSHQIMWKCANPFSDSVRCICTIIYPHADFVLCRLPIKFVCAMNGLGNLQGILGSEKKGLGVCHDSFSHKIFELERRNGFESNRQTGLVVQPDSLFGGERLFP